MADQHLTETPLVHIITPSIADDKTISASASALDPILSILSLSVAKLLLVPRLFLTAGYKIDAARFSAPLRRLIEAAGGLTPLTTPELEHLAWRYHVDYRDTAHDDISLALMITGSISWHRIKGTPAAMRRALALYGYTAEIEEDGEGTHWAAYQLRFDSIPSAADLQKISRICADVEPARCRLWRVYVPEYDLRPFLWSGGLGTSRNASLRGWSEGLWSYYTGRDADGIPGETDDRGLLISFGRRLPLGTERYAPQDLAAGVGREEDIGSLCPYVDRLIWSRFVWSDDSYPPMTGFVIGQLLRLSCAVWTQNTGYESPIPDRPRERWAVSVTSVARVEAVWSEPSGEDIEEFLSGTWGDINFTYSTLPDAAAAYTARRWGDTWGTATGRRNTIILSRSQSGVSGSTTETVDGSMAAAGIAGGAAAQTEEKARIWIGEWDGRRWLTDYGYLGIKEVSA